MRLKPSNSKGQAALEYMMTYGWAILVVIVVLGALWQMGVFNAPATPPGCSGFSMITPLDTQLQGNTLNVVISNDAGAKLDVRNVRVNIDTFTATDSSDYIMRPGASNLITFDMGNTFPSGEYYRANIVIEYNNTVSSIIHKSTGYCWGNVE